MFLQSIPTRTQSIETKNLPNYLIKTFLVIEGIDKNEYCELLSSRISHVKKCLKT